MRFNFFALLLSISPLAHGAESIEQIRAQSAKKDQRTSRYQSILSEMPKLTDLQSATGAELLGQMLAHCFFLSPTPLPAFDKQCKDAGIANAERVSLKTVYFAGFFAELAVLKQLDLRAPQKSRYFQAFDDLSDPKLKLNWLSVKRNFLADAFAWGDLLKVCDEIFAIPSIDPKDVRIFFTHLKRAAVMRHLNMVDQVKYQQSLSVAQGTLKDPKYLDRFIFSKIVDLYKDMLALGLYGQIEAHAKVSLEKMKPGQIGSPEFERYALSVAQAQLAQANYDGTVKSLLKYEPGFGADHVYVAAVAAYFKAEAFRNLGKFKDAEASYRRAMKLAAENGGSKLHFEALAGLAMNQFTERRSADLSKSLRQMSQMPQSVAHVRAIFAGGVELMTFIQAKKFSEARRFVTEMKRVYTLTAEPRPNLACQLSLAEMSIEITERSKVYSAAEAQALRRTCASELPYVRSYLDFLLTLDKKKSSQNPEAEKHIQQISKTAGANSQAAIFSQLLLKANGPGPN